MFLNIWNKSKVEHGVKVDLIAVADPDFVNGGGLTLPKYIKVRATGAQPAPQAPTRGVWGHAPKNIWIFDCNFLHSGGIWE